MGLQVSMSCQHSSRTIRRIDHRQERLSVPHTMRWLFRRFDSDHSCVHDSSQSQFDSNGLAFWRFPLLQSVQVHCL